jgi:hypothetical protein
MRFLRNKSRHEETECTAWDEELAGPLARQLTDAYTATKVPADLYSRIESAARMERFSPEESNGRQVRLLPRIAASGLAAACLLVAATVVIGHHSAPRTASPLLPLNTSRLHGGSSPSHGMEATPPHAPFATSSLRPSAFEVQVAAWRAKSRVVAIGYSVRAVTASYSSGYVLQAPTLEWKHHVLPGAGCPASEKRVSGYPEYLCFNVAWQVATRAGAPLVLRADGVRVVPVLSSGLVLGRSKSSKAAAPTMSYGTVVYVKTADRSSTRCIGTGHICTFALTVRLKPQVFLDSALALPPKGSHVPAPHPTQRR